MENFGLEIQILIMKEYLFIKCYLKDSSFDPFLQLKLNPFIIG